MDKTALKRKACAWGFCGAGLLIGIAWLAAWIVHVTPDGHWTEVPTMITTFVVGMGTVFFCVSQVASCFDRIEAIEANEHKAKAEALLEDLRRKTVAQVDDPIQRTMGKSQL